jgi:2-keto-4-pentenoate hydratase/2-oxohepta-3-ene-1,7-dioic acid hydratase in catechol pathway
MNVLITIHYISNNNKVMQRGSFPLGRKSKEQVAYEWLKQIKREMPYYEELEKVICDGEDYTEKVKEFEKKKLKDLSNYYCP